MAEQWDELPPKAETLPILTGKFSGLRKFRVGDFRMIFSIIGNTALILRIRHRKEAYRSNITSLRIRHRKEAYRSNITSH
jgi:mRNA-degrading endonuclease RelE of RelBE toxin-antitoxin system